MFQIKRISDVKLNSDFSNISNVTGEEIKLELSKNGERGEAIQKMVLDKMIKTASSGHGKKIETIPAPFRQSQLECQTLCLINGIRTVGEVSTIDTIGSSQADVVNNIKNAIKSGRNGVNYDSGGIYSMRNAYLAIRTFGIELSETKADTNPIKLAQKLFKEGAFLAISNSSNWHATSYIPLAGANSESFVAKLDSLTDVVEIISVEDFFKLIINKDNFNDEFRIYTLNNSVIKNTTNKSQ